MKMCVSIMAATVSVMILSSAIFTESTPLVGAGDSHQSPFKSSSRFLAARENSTSTLIIKTCDQAPALCLHKGSPGPECCNRQCVNLETDRLHCGKCGAKCHFSETCCGGKCVNPFNHDEHCGECYKRCGKGDSCVYGMCAYAN
uniref:Stigma-specific Stig1 family protein n=1 Tax=Kalanchoe fedtschenkoi TaxID=63787 RepID=A0A7N0UHX2_KALFE